MLPEYDTCITEKNCKYSSLPLFYILVLRLPKNISVTPKEYLSDYFQMASFGILIPFSNQGLIIVTLRIPQPALHLQKYAQVEHTSTTTQQNVGQKNKQKNYQRLPFKTVPIAIYPRTL